MVINTAALVLGSVKRLQDLPFSICIVHAFVFSETQQNSFRLCILELYQEGFAFGTVNTLLKELKC